jgi:hypothetical protein
LHYNMHKRHTKKSLQKQLKYKWNKLFVHSS